MSDLVKSIEKLYRTILLAEQFPEAFSLKDKIFSSRALKQHFAEKKFLKGKKAQILSITHALGSVAVFKNIPNPPESETKKVIESIKRAMDMDPDLFKNEYGDMLVRDALSFLKKHDHSAPSNKETGYIKEPVSKKLADELKHKGYSDEDLNSASDFAKKIAQKMFEDDN